MTENWNPEIENQKVRLIDNPGRQGITSGQIKQKGSRLLVLVELGSNEKSWYSYDLLELCEQPDEIDKLLEKKRFGSPDDLRRILTFEKIKGDLTNILYSMESSNTDFFPHQFKPVLKFLDSPVGRLLIADEVGLGKTIEAMYIWKELQARESATRLLIVCPAILRGKWQTDLVTRFNFKANIKNAKEILKELNLYVRRNKPNTESFIYITSLEGLRPPVKKDKYWKNEDIKGTTAELARLFDNNRASDESGLFDLVVIDEGHYLRNPQTANNQLGRLLRDASRHLVLLTATPIQINSINLYELLKIISPDDFTDRYIFKDMLAANASVVEALRLIWTSPDREIVKQAVETALQSRYFSDHVLLKRVHQELEKSDSITPQMRVRLGDMLEKSSLFGQYMTRSRKRDVLENKVIREPCTLILKFSELEKKIYNSVTHKIRIQAQGQQGVALFRLIARQRQMASCMVAALEAWQQKNQAGKSVLDDLLQEDEELLWEDFGVSQSDFDEEILPLQSLLIDGKVDINELEKHDTKYTELIKFILQKVKENSQEKFVLFAYFRGTLGYLRRRLESDNISVCLIMGGMKNEKEDVLKEFKNTSISVLLSSEVGSEGIDLQFCRFLINYDLPWNPMRVEQRIGRLDRLGQKANKIFIAHFSIQETIEERILYRLYERLNIFKESIGDLEEILGEMTEKLLVNLFNPQLSDEQREKQANQNLLVIANKKAQQENLENEAIQMMAFSDYILTKICTSREQGRWLQPEELVLFVSDFFQRQYSGTKIAPKRNQDNVYEIELSSEAKTHLRLFIKGYLPSTSTRLDRANGSVLCFFDSKLTDVMGKGYELLEPTHPLIKWIVEKYETGTQIHPVSASCIEKKCLDNSAADKIILGDYIYLTYRWQFKGLRTEKRLVHKVIRIADRSMLSEDESEALVVKTSLYGQPKLNASNLIDDMQSVMAVYHQCQEDIEFNSYETARDEFKAENTSWCDRQERTLQASADRRRSELQERIERFKVEGKLRIIPADEGQINKIDQELNYNLEKIKQKRRVADSFKLLAAGFISVEDYS